MNKGFFTSIKNLHLSKDKLLLILLGGVLLIIVSLPVKKSDTAMTQKETGTGTVTSDTMRYVPDNEEEYVRSLEKKLEELLSRAAGVGKVRVMITLMDTGGVIIGNDVKENTKISVYGDGKDQKTVTEIVKEETAVYTKENGGIQSPFVTERVLPKIGGVLVIAQGAGNAKVMADIVEAIQAVLGIGANKIKVMKMEG